MPKGGLSPHAQPIMHPLLCGLSMVAVYEISLLTFSNKPQQLRIGS